MYGRLFEQNGTTQGGEIGSPKMYINTNTPFSALVCGVQVSMTLAEFDPEITHLSGFREEPFYICAAGERADQ